MKNAPAMSVVTWRGECGFFMNSVYESGSALFRSPEFVNEQMIAVNKFSLEESKTASRQVGESAKSWVLV
jgi:hypothetical protein